MAAAFFCLWLVPGATTTVLRLEDFTEGRLPSSAVALGLSESRGTRPPSAAA